MVINQKGYVIPLTLIIFALLVAFLLVPRKFPNLRTGNTFGGGSKVVDHIASPSSTQKQIQLKWFSLQR